jgi:hypothetical protein
VNGLSDVCLRELQPVPEMIGHGADEVIGRPAKELFAANDIPGLLEHSDFMSSRMNVSVSFSFDFKDVSNVPLQARATINRTAE